MDCRRTQALAPELVKGIHAIDWFQAKCNPVFTVTLLLRVDSHFVPQIGTDTILRAFPARATPSPSKPHTHVRLMPLEIILHPHPTLRYVSKPIRRVDSELKKLVAEMFDLMYEARGVGLAANQVNLPLKLFVANPSGEKGSGEEFVIINPEIQKPKGSEVAEEGCLSLPGILGDVKRPKSVQLSAYDLKGNPIEARVDGFLARVFQHENDHLNGCLFFDRMAEDMRNEIMPDIQDLEIDFRSRQQGGGIEDDETLISRLSEWTDKYA